MARMPDGRPTDPAADGRVPPTVSARGYLRSGLPAIYRQGDLGMDFVGALETLLDPIVATLDALHQHFDPDLAPTDLLELMADWLGIELDESWPESRQRELVRLAAELARRRGTRGGLELALSVAFPDLPLRIEDAGGVVTAGAPDELPPATPPSFVVYCDQPLAEPAHLARMIERMKPVHVSYRLRTRRQSA
jgi:phage tail-like protein